MSNEKKVDGSKPLEKGKALPRLFYIWLAVIFALYGLQFRPIAQALIQQFTG